MRAIGVVTRLTLREAARRRILLAALGLGLLFLAVYGAGLHFMHRDLVRSGEALNLLLSNQLYNLILLAGLYVVNFLFAVIAVLTSVDTVSGEIASGTIQSLVSKPVRRWQVLLGKWLGFVLMLTLYLVLMAGGVMGIHRVITGYRVPNAGQGLILIWLNGLLLLNVTLLGGARLSTLANGVMVLAAYGIAFIGGWIEQIGALLQSATAVNVGIVTSLLLPSEALWRCAAYAMRSPLGDLLGSSPFTLGGSVPSPLMVGYALFYAAAALGLAMWSFSRRDL